MSIESLMKDERKKMDFDKEEKVDEIQRDFRSFGDERTGKVDVMWTRSTDTLGIWTSR